MMIWRMAAVGLLVGGVCTLHANPIPVSAFDVPGTQLTWEDCVRLAIHENPDLQSSREAVINSDAVRMGAYSALYPQISLSFGDTRSYVGANLYSPYVYSSSYSEQVSLSQQIFNGFATKGNIDQARAQLNLAFANLNGEKATVSFNLKSSFAQLLYAQKLIKIDGDIVDIRQSNARLVKLLYEGGSEDKGDMQLSQANLDQALYNLDQAVRTRDLSGIQLGVYIGKDLPPPVLAEGELQTDVLPVMPDFNQLAVLTPSYFRAPGPGRCGGGRDHHRQQRLVPDDQRQRRRLPVRLAVSAEESRLVGRVFRLLSALPGRRDLLRCEGRERLAAAGAR